MNSQTMTNTHSRLGRRFEASSILALTLLVGQLASIATAGAQVDSALRLEHISALQQARAQSSNLARTGKAINDFLNSAMIWAETKQRLDPLLPEIRATLSRSGVECALVHVQVDKDPADVAPKRVRYVGVIGYGEGAVPVLIDDFKNHRGHTIGPGPAKGYVSDSASSYLLCLSLQNGKLVSSSVFMPVVRRSVEQAINKLSQD